MISLRAKLNKMDQTGVLNILSPKTVTLAFQKRCSRVRSKQVVVKVAARIIGSINIEAKRTIDLVKTFD